MASAILPICPDPPWGGKPVKESKRVHHEARLHVGPGAQSAGLQNVHPHTLRHSCGYHLADKGTDLRTMQDYRGHRDPRHTVHYSRITGRRFEGLWR
jgi:type 1 fimbriae regulatory protein FimB